MDKFPRFHKKTRVGLALHITIGKEAPRLGTVKVDLAEVATLRNGSYRLTLGSIPLASKNLGICKVSQYLKLSIKMITFSMLPTRPTRNFLPTPFPTLKNSRWRYVGV